MGARRLIVTGTCLDRERYHNNQFIHSSRWRRGTTHFLQPVFDTRRVEVYLFLVPWFSLPPWHLFRLLVVFPPFPLSFSPLCCFRPGDPYRCIDFLFLEVKVTAVIDSMAAKE